jgi:hypothetical protein
VKKTVGGIDLSPPKSPILGDFERLKSPRMGDLGGCSARYLVAPPLSALNLRRIVADNQQAIALIGRAGVAEDISSLFDNLQPSSTFG